RRAGLPLRAARPARGRLHPRRPRLVRRTRQLRLGDSWMARPMTLFTGQWADLPLEKVAELASGWGYDGLELACWGDHFEVDKAVSDENYIEGRRELLKRYNLEVWTI